MIMKYENEIDDDLRKKAKRPRTVADLREVLEGLPDGLPLAAKYEVIVTRIIRGSGRDKLALSIREDF